MNARLFYFIADAFPAWRSDVEELFGQELSQRGLNIFWSMRQQERGAYRLVESSSQVVMLPASLGRGSGFAKLANRLLEALGEIGCFVRLMRGPRYDFIQVRDDRYIAAFWALIAARLTGGRFVYWLSFPFPENDAEMAKSSGGLRKIFLSIRTRTAGWWLYKFILPKTDHVFVQSDAMRNNLMALGIPFDKMTPVPMGVPNRLVHWVANHTPVVVPGLIAYIGTMAASRRLEMVLDAFALVHARRPDARLVMVGDGIYPRDLTVLKTYALELGIADCVTFTGFISMDKAWEIAAGAAVGLSPFYPDQVLNVSSPTKLVEFMAVGRPVVANHHPEQSEVLADSRAGLSVDWDAKAFSEAIIWLLEHPAEANEMGKNGSAWVSEHRTYSLIADNVWNVYDNLLQVHS